VVVVVEEASMVVVSAVAVVSMGEVSVVVSTAAVAEVESASAEHTFQVALGTLPAEDPGFLHLGIRHLGSPSMMDELADP
jgi:hypothetical protein